MEKRGVAYCSSDFSSHREAVRTVFAKPVFTVANTAHEQLPLTDLYDHIDYIDLISAQEFGLEGIFPGRFLLCILVAQTVEALGEMEKLILGVSTPSIPSVSAESDGERIAVGGRSVPLSEKAQDLLRELSDASAEEVIAALTQWCVGYRVQLFLSEGAQ